MCEYHNWLVQNLANRNDMGSVLHRTLTLSKGWEMPDYGIDPCVLKLSYNMAYNMAWEGGREVCAVYLLISRYDSLEPHREHLNCKGSIAW